MKEIILEKTKTLEPTEIEVINFSHLHAGHSGDNGTGESHFSVLIVSEKFQDLSKIDRHKLVYQCLNDEIQERIHALKLKVFTPDEYKNYNLKNSKK